MSTRMSTWTPSGCLSRLSWPADSGLRRKRHSLRFQPCCEFRQGLDCVTFGNQELRPVNNKQLAVTCFAIIIVAGDLTSEVTGGMVGPFGWLWQLAVLGMTVSFWFMAMDRLRR
jgi:hypothetical protein